jgi:hypothetical protein
VKIAFLQLSLFPKHVGSFSYMTIAAGIFIVVGGHRCFNIVSFTVVGRRDVMNCIPDNVIYHPKHQDTQRPPTQNAFRFIPIPPRFSSLFIFGRCRR